MHVSPVNQSFMSDDPTCSPPYLCTVGVTKVVIPPSPSFPPTRFLLHALYLLCSRTFDSVPSETRFVVTECQENTKAGLRNKTFLASGSRLVPHTLKVCTPTGAHGHGLLTPIICSPCTPRSPVGFCVKNQGFLLFYLRQTWSKSKKWSPKPSPNH